VSSYIPRPLSDVNCVLLTDLDNVLVEILQENKGSVMSVFFFVPLLSHSLPLWCPVINFIGDVLQS